MAYANLAWGVRLDDPDRVGTFHKSLLGSKQISSIRGGIEVLVEESIFSTEMNKLFGIRPAPEFPAGAFMSPEQRAKYTAELHEWLQYRRNEIPVTPAYFGGVMGEYGHHLLIFKDTWHTAMDMSMNEVDASLLAYPSVDSISRLDKILDHFDFTGNRTIMLLLAASYE